MKRKSPAGRFGRTITRRAKVLFACTALASFGAAGLQALHPAVAQAATNFVFTGMGEPSHSLWDNAGNWDPPGLPGPNDNVTIGSLPLGGCAAVQGIPDGTEIHGLTLGGCGTASLSCRVSNTSALCGGDLTVTATVNWTDGKLISPLTLLPGATLNINGSGTKTLTTDGMHGAGVLSLLGTTKWSGPGPLNVGGFDGPAVINNIGTFHADPGASMNGLSCCQNPSRFNNRGTLVIPAGSGTVLISFVSYNPVFHGPQASGRTVVGKGSTLELQGAPSTWSAGARFAGAGRTLIDDSANPTLQGTIFLSAGHTLELGADALGSPGSISGNGTLQGNLGNGIFVWSAGTVLGSLSVGRSVTGLIRGPAAKTLGDSSTPGSGGLNLAGPTFLSSALNFTSPAILINTGTFIALPGASMTALDGQPQFRNLGNLENNSRSATVAITNVQLVNGPAGTINLASGVLGVNFTPQNGGPGFVEPRGATLKVAIGGTAPGTGFGQLQVSSTAALAGDLVVTNVRGFMPTPGQTFKVITCGTACTGRFKLLGVGYSAAYHPRDVTLKAQ